MLGHKGELLNKQVLIQYRFDLDCGQLIQAAYIFGTELNDRDILFLSKAISDKYEIAPITISHTDPRRVFVKFYLPNKRVEISSDGDHWIYPGQTSVNYRTENWSYFYGFAEGTEPDCEEFDEKLRRLQEKL